MDSNKNNEVTSKPFTRGASAKNPKGKLVKESKERSSSSHSETSISGCLPRVEMGTRGQYARAQEESLVNSVSTNKATSLGEKKVPEIDPVLSPVYDREHIPKERRLSESLPEKYTHLVLKNKAGSGGEIYHNNRVKSKY